MDTSTNSSANSTQDPTSADPNDYYAMLGLAKSADDEAIKKAYRKLAMKYHPDRNPGDAKAEEVFKNVKTAYETLSNPDLRANYDRFGVEGAQGFSNGSSGFSPGSHDSMADFMQQFMHGMNGAHFRSSSGPRTPPPPAAGEDILRGVRITLEEAYAGKRVQVSIPVENTCTTCEGTGSKTKSAPTTCETCQGAGVVHTKAHGFFVMQYECPTCHSAGKAVPSTDACSACDGAGHIEDKEIVEIDIPAGINSDMRVRVSGRGRKSPHANGAAGDLYLDVQVEAHQVYQRDEMDLHTGIDVPWTTAALGGVQKLTLLDGTELEVDIPQATQHGQILRARNKGMPNPRNANQRGNLMMHLNVEVPTKLSSDQKRLMRELQTSLEKDAPRHTPLRTDWLEKAKDWLG